MNDTTSPKPTELPNWLHQAILKAQTLRKLADQAEDEARQLLREWRNL